MLKPLELQYSLENDQKRGIWVGTVKSLWVPTDEFNLDLSWTTRGDRESWGILQLGSTCTMFGHVNAYLGIGITFIDLIVKDRLY